MLQSDRLTDTGGMTSEHLPRVSVIIPAYNQARYLRQAIDSVLAQTYRDFEIIVVDDGSTDDTAAIAATYTDQIHYVHQENRGLGGARNTGILHAKGDFVGLLDADDQWLPNYLNNMLLLIEIHSEADVYYCRAQAMDADGDDLPQVFGGSTKQPDDLQTTLLRSNFIIPSTVLLRRSVVINFGLFEESDSRVHGCEDWDMWLRLLPDHEFVSTNEILARYRVHGSSLSANTPKMQQAVRSVIEKHFGPDDGQWNEWSVEKRRAYGGVYRYSLITSVQRQNDWQAGSNYLLCALKADPSLCLDLNLFYELALGSQPTGYRGTTYQLDIMSNARGISQLLRDTFDLSPDTRTQSLRRLTYGTANYALGLASYNAGLILLARRFLILALYFRPALWKERLVIGNLLRSFLGVSGLTILRNLRKWNASQ